MAHMRKRRQFFPLDFFSLSSTSLAIRAFRKRARDREERRGEKKTGRVFHAKRGEGEMGLMNKKRK